MVGVVITRLVSGNLQPTYIENISYAFRLAEVMKSVTLVL